MGLHVASNSRRRILRAVLLLAMNASDHSMDDSSSFKSSAPRTLRRRRCRGNRSVKFRRKP
jgi:hypothetical protein